MSSWCTLRVRARVSQLKSRIQLLCFKQYEFTFDFQITNETCLNIKSFNAIANSLVTPDGALTGRHAADRPQLIHREGVGTSSSRVGRGWVNTREGREGRENKLNMPDVGVQPVMWKESEQGVNLSHSPRTQCFMYHIFVPACLSIFPSRRESQWKFLITSYVMSGDRLDIE
jgi:hypothetical protein